MSVSFPNALDTYDEYIEPKSILHITSRDFCTVLMNAEASRNAAALHIEGGLFARNYQELLTVSENYITNGNAICGI